MQRNFLTLTNSGQPDNKTEGNNNFSSEAFFAEDIISFPQINPNDCQEILNSLHPEQPVKRITITHKINLSSLLLDANGSIPDAIQFVYRDKYGKYGKKLDLEPEKYAEIVKGRKSINGHPAHYVGKDVVKFKFPYEMLANKYSGNLPQEGQPREDLILMKNIRNRIRWDAIDAPSIQASEKTDVIGNSNSRSAHKRKSASRRIITADASRLYQSYQTQPWMFELAQRRHKKQRQQADQSQQEVQQLPQQLPAEQQQAEQPQKDIVQLPVVQQQPLPVEQSEEQQHEINQRLVQQEAWRQLHEDSLDQMFQQLQKEKMLEQTWHEQSTPQFQLPSQPRLPTDDAFDNHNVLPKFSNCDATLFHQAQVSIDNQVQLVEQNEHNIEIDNIEIESLFQNTNPS